LSLESGVSNAALMDVALCRIDSDTCDTGDEFPSPPAPLASSTSGGDMPSDSHIATQSCERFDIADDSDADLNTCYGAFGAAGEHCTQQMSVDEGLPARAGQCCTSMGSEAVVKTCSFAGDVLVFVLVVFVMTNPRDQKICYCRVWFFQKSNQQLKPDLKDGSLERLLMPV
jgi:hypothetical protein